ncbi:nucleoside diphosphate kinase regulator [Ramlibacter tataouinensis]|uniref:nucleoside diphosphate kinase regulator n=1 Tax=Ramlibacter tataouinensis TaxID=94132 RepID=UPI0022F37FF8|nr:nucleoside diphosphate kinase regulator [Ramlibacter tataouinensis]WBY02805.1 nucleoside diphosphate kinase regulator [Ramlibacter tataouinensis]
MTSEVQTERTLTELDHARLTKLLAQTQRLASPASQAMHDLLEGSDVVESPSVPATVVTMYTQVLVRDTTGGEPHKVTLCYPDDAEPASGFISVLSPLGTSLLGLKVGETARWRLPGGEERSAVIESVLFQPEASGDYKT